MSRESITRRNLPHWYVPGAAHFVTFRLANSLPAAVLENLKARAQQLLAKAPLNPIPRREQRLRVHKQIFAEYDRQLDNHREIVWLQEPAVAAMVRDSLYHHDGSQYRLLAYTIMPNHVHLLLMPLLDHSADAQVREVACGESQDSSSPLSRVMHSLKSFTAHAVNKLLARTGAFWQHESYDHWVRDDDELERIVDYINANAVRAGLTRRPQEWRWSSAHDRYLADGDVSGWLNSGSHNRLDPQNMGTSEDAYATT